MLTLITAATVTATSTAYWVLILCADPLCHASGEAFRPLTMQTTEAQCRASVSHATDSRFEGVRAVCIGPDGSRLDSYVDLMKAKDRSKATN